METTPSEVGLHVGVTEAADIPAAEQEGTTTVCIHGDKLKAPNHNEVLTSRGKRTPKQQKQEEDYKSVLED